MVIEIQKGFKKDMRGIPSSIQKKVATALRSVREAESFADIPHLKPLSGYSNYFRIKIGQYRIGLFWDGEQFLIESIGVRGDFYKSYPPD